FGPKIEMYDRLSAIQQLARMQGWESAQKHDHTSSDGSMSPKGKSLDDFYAGDVPA
ncbi:terminase small subunit, partial [Pseudomonas protegens]|nr:terminase small subunit [Pseudomonas protegens]